MNTTTVCPGKLTQNNCMHRKNKKLQLYVQENKTQQMYAQDNENTTTVCTGQ